jgi:hypothetical protein
MKGFKMRKPIAVLASFFAPLCMAATPATIADVDAAAATLQTQINTLNDLPAIAHPIGSCYGGGVVIYINTTPGAPAGQQGLIAKLQDSTAGCTGTTVGGCIWSNPAPLVFIGTSPGYFTGEANTNLIRSSLSSTEAANAAYDTTPSPDCQTCTNWYLPAQYELYTIYAQSSLVGNTLWTNCDGTPPISSIVPNSSLYWSSTQSTTVRNTTFSTNFYDGSTTSATATNPAGLHVRAVRAF